MKRYLLSLAAVAAIGLAVQAQAQESVPLPLPAAVAATPSPLPSATPYWYGATYNPAMAWHGYYYDACWNMPYALVVPPTVGRQCELSWGVPSSRVSPISYRFRRAFPGPAPYDPSAFQPTPRWPSDTGQFGVYYVRGPRG
jgi:hypothetical protein